VPTDDRSDADLPGAGLPPQAPGRRTPSGRTGAGKPPSAAASGPGTPPAGLSGGTPPSAAVQLPEGASGPELARAVLDAALAQRKARAPRRRTPDGSYVEGVGADGKTRRRLRGYSGPGPDPRDPQLFGAVLERLMKARGWQKPAAEATVFGAWEKVVGPDIAQHSRPVKLENGELTVEAESTAWATQLRMLAGSLIKRIAAEVGHNVVLKLHIHGPAAPSWNKGPRRVRGRGPRDTYG
jgi:predicted nucleic acid-binding Zn ribbon protein